MQRSAAMAIIKTRLGNLQGTDIDPAIIANMQLVQSTVLERAPELPWFLAVDSNKEGTNLATVADQEYVDLPAKFLRINANIRYPVLRVDSDQESGYAEIKQLDYSTAIGRYSSANASNAGKPVVYDLIGEQMFFRYIPNQIYTIRLFYYQMDDVLDMDIENLWLKYAPDWLIAETCRQTAEDLQLQALIDKFTIDATKAYNRVYAETVARSEAGAMHVVGDDDAN